jgi:hypothetical protein
MTEFYPNFFSRLSPRPLRLCGKVFDFRTLGLFDFLRAVQNHHDLDTRIDRRSSAGLSISLKRPKQP